MTVSFAHHRARLAALILALPFLTGCASLNAFFGIGTPLVEPKEFTAAEIHEVRKPYEHLDQSIVEPYVPPSVSTISLDSTLVEIASTSLARIGEPAIEPLIQTMSDTDPRVRIVAIEALARMGPTAAPAVPNLIAALDDADLQVRREAARALGEIGPAAADAVPALIKALHSADAPPPTDEDPPTL